MAEPSSREQEPEPELPVQPEEISPEQLERERLEEEWSNSKRPRNMLQQLGDDNKYDRKLRLFAVACCEKLEGLFRSNIDRDNFRERLSIAERYAEGLVDDQELENIAHKIIEADYLGTIPNPCRRLALSAARNSSLESAQMISQSLYRIRRGSQKTINLTEKKFSEEELKQADLLRDVIRNPFSKELVKLDPRWLSSTVVDLVKAIYEEKNFEIMPILADALMDAGCDNEEILAHCRQDQDKPGQCSHVRGCWVIDLLLNK